jgi:uncharacterized small protein (DUF1192 family)
MVREIAKNEELEVLFQNIKKITGQTDLNGILNKIINKDKDYNLAVSQVTELETRIDITQTKIEELKNKLKILQNDSKLVS